MSLDTCKVCKTVSGDGPLTGDYVLVDTELDTQEFNCMDGCVYNRVGEDEETKYCFRIDYTPYTVEACEQVGRYKLEMIFCEKKCRWCLPPRLLVWRSSDTS